MPHDVRFLMYIGINLLALDDHYENQPNSLNYFFSTLIGFNCLGVFAACVLYQ